MAAIVSWLKQWRRSDPSFEIRPDVKIHQQIGLLAQSGNGFCSAANGDNGRWSLSVTQEEKGRFGIERKWRGDSLRVDAGVYLHGVGANDHDSWTPTEFEYRINAALTYELRSHMRRVLNLTPTEKNDVARHIRSEFGEILSTARPIGERTTLLGQNPVPLLSGRDLAVYVVHNRSYRERAEYSLLSCMSLEIGDRMDGRVEIGAVLHSVDSAPSLLSSSLGAAAADLDLAMEASKTA